MVIEAGDARAQDSQRDSRRPGPDTPKPLEDPKVGEVVLQDLATQEIKRVRRTESSHSPPAAAASAAAVDGLPENGVTPADQRQQQPRPNGGGKAEGEEKSGLGGTGKKGTSAGGSEPQTAESKGDGQGEEDPRPKVGGSGGAAEESSGGDEGVRAEGESTKPNGVAVAGAASSSSSKAAGAMPPPLPKSPAVDLPSSSSSPSSSGAEESPSFVSDRKTAVQARSSEGARPGPEAGHETKRKAAEGESKGKGKGKGAEEGAGEERRTTSRCPDHALPVARTFFDFEAVSGLEMRMLPEFFTGRSASKTQEMYMQSRNYMVRSYQRMLEVDPDGQAFLTGTECRRKLAGDACSILRIHDFLDRFGLINTHAVGKRPASYSVAPPATHLWNQTTRSAGPPPPVRRAAATTGGQGGASAAAAAPTTTTAERGFGRGDGGGEAGARRAQQRAGLGSGAGGGGDEREWRREELVLLMEAAVANPNRWDAVARQVAGGRTPAECMQRFLSLAVEDVVQGNEKPPAAVPAAAAAAAAGTGATVEEATGSTAAAGGWGGAAAAGQQAATAGGISSNGNTASGEGKDAGTTADQGRSHDRLNQQQERPEYLGPEVPALVLASALVSSVHPEVLKAAMSAAAEAADAIAAAATANHDRDRGFPPTGGSSGGERAGVAAAVEASGSRPDEEDGDVEMPDVKDLAGPAPRSRPGEPPAVDTAPVAANGGGAGAGAGEDGRVAAAGAPGSRVARGCAGGGSSASLSSSAGGLELATAARAAVLSVAGLQARGLAEQEERRTEALLADLLEARVQRLEAKLHCFDELDQVLETERACLEHDRAELVFEQARSMLRK
ncbi:unnamed protein product [Ectocarpus sp. 13 AM-2016]